MNSKKRGIVISLILISVMLVGFASASFWDIFKIKFGSEGGQGQLPNAQPSTAQVQITGCSTNPIIWNVTKLNGTGGDANPLMPSVATYFQYNVLACSSCGPANINDSSFVSIVNGTYGGGKGSVTATCTAAPSNALPVSGCSTGSRNYNCTIKMLYYYDPVIWTINATVYDLSSTPKIASNLSTTFNVNTLTYINITPNSVNWTNVQAGVVKGSDNNITILNLGNLDVNATSGNLSIQSFNLTCQSGNCNVGVDKITPDNFNVSITQYNPCSGGVGIYSLNDSQFLRLPELFINHSTSTEFNPTTNATAFCLKALSGVNPGTYAALGANMWQFKAFG